MTLSYYYPYAERVIKAALAWERDRAKTTQVGAGEKEHARFFRSAERLATAVRVYRRKHG